MKHVMAIAGKELRSYFASPIAYVVMAAFLVLTGYLFAVILFFSRQAQMSSVFSNMSIILLLVSPVLTMRLLAEEQKTGTIELLLTAPIRDAEVVAGKFLAGLAFLVAMLLPTLYYVALLFIYGQPDTGPILAGYVGILLLGAGLMAVGLLTSSLTQNQIVAAVVSFMAVLMLWLIGSASSMFSGSAADVIRYLGLDGHFSDFPQGVVSVKDVVYYLSVVAVALFLTVRSLETRRWR